MSNSRIDLPGLAERMKPFRVVYFPTLTSTNDHAASMRRERKLYAPSVIIADEQTVGRGRGSNSWWSGDGSLTVTFCLPVDDRLPPHHVPLLAGWAVREACIGLTENSLIEVKWPNDLWWNDLKFAGLLCERLDGVDLVGLGLNVNVVASDIPDSLRHRVTGLAAIAGRMLVMNDVLAAVAKSLDRWLLRRTEETFPSMLGDFDSAHALHGRTIRVTEPGATKPLLGVVQGLDADGRLLLRTGESLVRVVAGHVELA